jgi:hypothetical protein
MFSKGRAGTAPCHREGHRLLCERWPTNDKAAKRRPVIDPVICHGRNLERAKGLEPSTPTLARSCSTTELHPHPRWRRTFAVNGRPMPNADRECNSPRAIRCHADDPIFINKWERIGPRSGRQRDTGRFEAFSNQPPNILCQFVPHRSRNRKSLGLPRRGIGVPHGFRPIRSPMTRKTPAD